MDSKTIFATLVVVCALLLRTDAWWLVGKNGNNHQCPSRGGANPYYFGTTNLWCMHKGKRGPPSRGIWELKHRFIYYQGYYIEFLGNSKAYIATHRQASNRCSGGRENSPAGYSQLGVDCIKGCARNYRCHFGHYGLLSNNCHKFANRISAVLCTSGRSCPS
eukprot:XP_011440635.1 PREDICTED: uncharacterized protein LOC105337561 [Crassostrea gigas]